MKKESALAMVAVRDVVLLSVVKTHRREESALAMVAVRDAVLLVVVNTH